MVGVIGLQKAYADQTRQVRAVKDVSFEVAKGAFLPCWVPRAAARRRFYAV